jgi:ABC-type transport system involved in Fe-S cluster assembly fused permease/ATPase subunit
LLTLSVENISQQLKALIKLRPYLWPKDDAIRRRFLVAIFLLLVTMGLNAGVPLVFRAAINEITTPSGILTAVHWLLLSYGLLWTLSKLTTQLRMMIMFPVVERGIHLLSLTTFNHLMQLEESFHVKRKTGAIINAIDRAQQGLPALFWGLFFTVIPTLGEVLIAATIVFYLYGVVYASILLAILGSYLLFTLAATEWMLSAQRFAHEQSATSSAKIADSLLNYQTVANFGNQVYETVQCQKTLAQREQAWVVQLVRGEKVFIGQGMIIGCGLLLLTWLSGMQVVAGTLQVSDFVLINAYLLQFSMPLSQFGFVLKGMNDGMSSINDVMTILEEKKGIHDVPHAKPLVAYEGKLQFENVSFAYDNKRPILQGLSFEVPAKKTVAIVGPSGAGKSTLVKLLLRRYEVNSGRILIDGQAIEQVEQASLQAHVGLVSQNTSLFNDTLYQNILYGNLNASCVEVQAAIKAAHLEALVSALPEGLNTLVGEQGVKLSGGEKQRIAIARALLRKPLIYVFDEATSSLDTQTERFIQNNIEEIAKDTTTLIIAHRLSTIVHADVILVLDKGRVAESGSHQALIKKKGLYAALWFKQAQSNKALTDNFV